MKETIFPSSSKLPLARRLRLPGAEGRLAWEAAGWWALLALVFLVGLAVRLYDLSDPPLDFHPTRQLHSALIARGMYYADNNAVPAWQRGMAVQQQRMEGIIEPQVMERLAAWSFALAGSADLRLPRLFAIGFWLLAGLFILLLALEWMGRPAALAAAAFFLFWPYGVIASRAFQPEPLMIALIAAALWALARWERSPSWRWAAAAGILAGLAVLIKTVAVFFLLPFFAVLLLARLGRQALRSPQVWLMALLLVLPSAVFYLDGLLIRGYLVSQFSQRFFPHLWLDPAFYLRWARNLSRVFPVALALAALAGVLLLPFARHRAALLGLWAGYLALGLTLPHHISTHDYYHLPLALPVSLGLGAAAQLVYLHLRGPRWLVRAVAVSLLLAGVAFQAYDSRAALKRFDAAAQAASWSAIGEQIGPGASVMALVPDYGSGLKYYAWINPVLWPARGDLELPAGTADQADAVRAYFDQQAAGRHYFVVTWFEEVERQPELQALLAERAALIAESPHYRLYDLRRMAP